VWDQRGFFGIMALATLGSMELTLRDIENGTFSRLIYLLKMVMFYSYVNDCKRLPEGIWYLHSHYCMSLLAFSIYIYIYVYWLFVLLLVVSIIADKIDRLIFTGSIRWHHRILSCVSD
jgi:hypothetical protein